MRAPVDRIGLGGYLHLVEPYPDFVDYIEKLAEEFRRLKELHVNDKPYVGPAKVAVLTAWGKLRSWICSGHMTPGLELNELIESLAHSERRAQQLRHQNEQLSRVQLAPELTAVEPLARLIEQCAAAEAKVAQAQQAHADAEAACTEAEQQLRDKAAGAICPTCGSSVDAQRLLAHTAQHGNSAEHGDTVHGH